MSHKFWQRVFAMLLITGWVLGLVSPVAAAPAAQSPAASSVEVEAELLKQIEADNTAGYLIYFRGEPDLSAAYKMDWVERGQFVMQALQNTAKASQANVIAYLDSKSVTYQSFWIDNVIAVDASNLDTFRGLQSFSEIESLRARRTMGIIEPEVVQVPEAPNTIEPNIDHVGAPDVWGLGITGEGLVIANIDTGVRYSHQALAPHYRGNLGSGVYDHNYNWFDPDGLTTAPYDGHGHGTHTMGTMVGDDGGDNQIGMAPGAKWIACAGCPNGGCTDTALLGCAEFMAAPTDLAGNNPDPAMRPNAVNNSWGDCGTTYDNWYQGVIDSWHAAGIYPVFSNGNASNCGYSEPPGLNTVGNPARYGNVTGVGSTGQSNGAYASHSNWGPTDNPDTVNPNPDDAFGAALKPQVVAPGVNIRSSVPGSDTSYQGGWSGTSMSAPHVTGLIALMWQAAPCLIGDYATTETIIEDTATPIPYASGGVPAPPVGNDPNYATGHGEINALAAVNEALGYCGDSTLSGTVSSAKLDAPIAGALVVVSNITTTRQTTTNAAGYYEMTLWAGTYDLTVSRYGYVLTTINDVVVDGATTQNVSMTPAETYTIDGVVSDDTALWPLYASLSISGPGFPGATVWTDPENGEYTVDLVAGITYTFDVAAWVAGYVPASADVFVEADEVVDFELSANSATCNAPGYHIVGGISENFDAAVPPAIPGWSTTLIYDPGTDPLWATNVGTRYPSGYAAHSTPNLVYFNSFSTGSGGQMRLYRTAGIDMTAVAEYNLSFWMFHDDGYAGYTENVQVQVSTDGGTNWVNEGPQFLRYSAAGDAWAQHAVDLSAYAAETDLLIGFLATSTYGNDMHLDDILMGAQCDLQSGGLVVGNVYDFNASLPLNGATVENEAGYSMDTVATPDDPAVDDSFYTLFSPEGSQVFTATLTDFGPDMEVVIVDDNDTVSQDFYLTAGYLEPVPPALDIAVDMGTDTTVPLTLTNTGTNAVAWELRERDNGYVPTAGEQVLVVRYDTTAAAAMEAALTANGITFLGVTDAVFQTMTVSDLLAYQAVFHAGSSSANGRTLMMAYLDAGGSLYISDNDLGYYNGSTPFYQTYLQATYVADNGGDLLTGEDIMAGLDLDVSADPYPDSFTVNAEGVRIFAWPTNAGGVVVDRAGYRAIYTAFDFQNIATTADETELVARVMAFLAVADVVPWMSESPTSGSVPAGDDQVVDVTLDAGIPSITQPGMFFADLVFANDSPYGDLVVPVTMTAVAPADWGRLEGVVTGLGYCDVDPAPLEGAIVNVQGDLGYTQTIETGADGSYLLWLDQDYSPVTVTVTYPEHEIGLATGVDVTGGMTTTQSFDLRWLVPCVGVAPDAMDVTLQLGDTTTLPMTLTNTGAATLDYNLVEVDGGFDPVVAGAPHTVELSLSNAGNTESVQSGPWINAGPVSLVVDDGSMDDSIGYNNSGTGTAYQYLWFNRFTPAAGDFPFQLNQISVIWPSGQVAVGDAIELVVYSDTDGDGDPANATYLASFNVTVQVADSTTWNVYDLVPSVSLVGPGDVLIGAVDRFIVSGVTPSNYPSAIDTTASQVRSWVAGWATDPPTPPSDLSTASNFGTIDSMGFAGNWMVRGSGTTGGGSGLPWLSESPFTGTVPANTGVEPIIVGFDAGAVSQPGTYMATLLVASNDPAGSVGFPVTMTVTAPDTYGKLEGTVTGLGYCDVNPEPLAGLDVVIEGALGTYTATTDAAGHYLYWLDEDESPVLVSVDGASLNYGFDLQGPAPITGTVTTVVDLTLRWLEPCIGFTPGSLHATVPFGGQVTMTLDISNDGPVALDFELAEQDGGYAPGEKPAVPDASVGGAAALNGGAVAETGAPAGEAVIGPASGGLAPEDIGAAWETMAPLPSARVFNAVVADTNGYVYVIGGTSDAGGATPTTTNYRYNTATNTWDTMAALPVALDSIDGIAINDKIYIPGSADTDTTYVYDIGSDSWSQIATSGGYSARSQYQVVAIGTDLYVLGGIVAAASASTTEVWVLDTTTGTWSAGIPMLKSRTSFSAAAIDGVIYVAGGVLFPGFTPDMTAEKFDGAVWTYIAGVPNGGGAYTRWSYNADGWGVDGLWLAAGRRDAGWAVLNHAGYYNPETDTWTDSPTIPTLTEGRVYMEGDVATDGYFYVIGGRDSAGAVAYATNERLEVGYPASPDVTWLSEDPIAGSVPADGGVTTVDVIFDAGVPEVTLPGDYLATLKVKSNDPVNGMVMVPVTMTVLAPEGYGKLEGDVIGLGYCDLDPTPLEGLVVTIEGSLDTYTATTNAGGHYVRWLAETESPVNVSVDGASLDYSFAMAGPVQITADVTTTVDFELRWLQPCVSVDPGAFDVNIGQGYSMTLPLELINTGAGALTWGLSEVPGTPLLTTVNVPAFSAAANPMAKAVSPTAGSHPAYSFTVAVPANHLEANIEVLLLTPDTVAGDISLIQNTLAAFTDLTVTTWDTADGDPTGADLEPYDVVIVGNDYTWVSSGMTADGVGNALADYIDAGGKVIDTEFVQSYDAWALAGRYITEGYSCFTPATQDFDAPPYTMGTVYDPNHPIMAGVLAVTDDPTIGYAHQDVGLAAGATRLADWNDGEIFVAFNDNVVGVNQMWYHGSNWSGNMPELMYNVIVWLAGGGQPTDVPWLSESPITGTVGAEGVFDVDITFDTMTYTVGVYTATLKLTSDDPVIDTIEIPVQMTIEAPAYGVDVSADQADSGLGGDVIQYTVYITNASNGPSDIFDLELGPHTFPTDLSDTSVALDAGDSAAVLVTVHIPADAVGGTYDTVQLTATSQGDNAKTDTATLTTDVTEVFDVVLVAVDDSLSGSSGTVIEYTLLVTNTGNVTDTFTVSFAGNDPAWIVQLPVTSLELGAGESDTFVVRVTIPAAAANGDSDIVTITVTGDGGAVADVDLTTTATGYKLYLPIVNKTLTP